MERTGRGPGWRSALLVAVFAQAGSSWAAQAQTGRVPLDAFARFLLLLGPALLLVRHRYPVAVVYGVSAVTLVYIGAGYPYGPVFVSLVLACFNAVCTGHRRAAWGAVGLLWAGHLLIGHWLYRWFPPAGDGRRPGGRNWASPRGCWRCSRSPSWSAYAGSSGPATGPSGRRPSSAGWTRSGCASPASSTTSSPTASR